MSQKYRIDVTGIISGNSELSLSTTETAGYNPSVILKYPLNCTVPERIGLLWDGSGFYRVDRDMEIISDSNFNPDSTWPFSYIYSDDGYTYFPKCYLSAEYVPELGSYGRVWWYDSEESNTNHIAPSFVENSGTQDSDKWIGSWLGLGFYGQTYTSSSETYRYYMNANQKADIYDHILATKLRLIKYAPGTKTIYCQKNSDFSNGRAWETLRKTLYETIIYGFHMDGGKLYVMHPSKIRNGASSGTTRIFVNTGITPSVNGVVRGNFCIENINGIEMGDLMLDITEPYNNYDNKTYPLPTAYQTYSTLNSHGYVENHLMSPLWFGTIGLDSRNISTRNKKLIS